MLRKRPRILTKRERFRIIQTNPTNTAPRQRRDVEIGRRKEPEEKSGIGTGLTEKGSKDARLQQKGYQRNKTDADCIDNAFCDHGAQGLGEGYAIVLGKDAATGDFADTGDDQIGCIGYEYGIYAIGQAGIFAQRSQCQIPSPAAQQMGQHAKDQRKEHPVVTHSPEQYIVHTTKIEIVIGPYQNGRSKQQRQNDLKGFVQELCYFYISSFQNLSVYLRLMLNFA